MDQLFTAAEYVELHSIVFRNDYPGYTPGVIESPNGDSKLDDKKQYAHVAQKYLERMPRGEGIQILTLSKYLDRAHDLAMQVAVAIGVPPEFWPSRQYGALRVLQYGPDAITNTHTDFDLFTLMCYRNIPGYFKYTLPELGTLRRKQAEQRSVVQNLMHEASLNRAKVLNEQVHFGEILEEINPSHFKADDHEVIASGGPYQYSIVYFAIPDHDATLPSGVTVGKWIDERIKRSRYVR
jgi:isopenicillin N synthase-like dioxygenase